jgi:hypothetical protein
METLLEGKKLCNDWEECQPLPISLPRFLRKVGEI